MGTNSDISICREYAQRVFKRATEPLEPPDFTIDWGNQPLPYKIYKNTERFALPLEKGATTKTIAEIMQRMASGAAACKQELTFVEFATMLYFAHGILDRRMRIRPYSNTAAISHYAFDILYARGTASGGGLYPSEIYWACGAQGLRQPGIYHYNNVHHAMELLCPADVTTSIRRAVFDHPAALHTDQFLLITMNFWKNAFKYNNFCYHVVTQDLGALLCSFYLLSTGFNVACEPILWYNDSQLNDLLGFDIDRESVFAVIPLSIAAASPASYAPQPEVQPDAVTRVEHHFYDTRQTRIFPLVADTHRSTLVVDGPHFGQQKAQQACVRDDITEEQRIALPPALIESLNDGVLETLQRRRSSFGSFAYSPPLSQAQLGTLLAFNSIMYGYGNDVKAQDAHIHFTRMMVIVMNVEGIDRGIYSYDSRTHSLQIVHKENMALFLQQHYFLQNYSLAEVSAVIVIVGDMEKMLATYGNRGYRILNAEVGMLTQSLYMASASLHLGCGAAAGFDNIAFNRVFHLDEIGQNTLMCIFVGNESKNIGDIDYRLI